ncbi:Mycobacterium terramassiliense ORFan, partial [Mycobacterium terramassiliense]
VTEEWQDIKRKTQRATQLHPDMGECVIEIEMTARMPDRWISHMRSVSRDIRYDSVVGDRIIARAEHPKAVPHVISFIDGAIRAANARYRADLERAEARKAQQEGDAARLAEQQAELDKIVGDIPDPE